MEHTVWFLFVLVIFLFSHVLSSDNIYSTKDETRIHFIDDGNVSNVLDHTKYEEVFEKFTSWMEYEDRRNFVTCHLAVSFGFSLNLKDKLLLDASLNVGCSLLKQWIIEGWEVDSGNKRLSVCGRTATEYCITGVMVRPAEKCKQDGDHIPFTNYSKLFDPFSVCGSDTESSFSAVGLLREFLSCNMSQTFRLSLDVYVTRSALMGSCLPTDAERATIRKSLERTMPTVPSLVSLTFQQADTCPGNLSCGDRTCYKENERCNFQLECIDGADEKSCWCGASPDGSLNSLSFLTTDNRTQLGANTFTQNGFRCEFEPLYGHQDCECPWNVKNFKLFSPSLSYIPPAYALTPYPKKDLTKNSTEGNFLLSAPFISAGSDLRGQIESLCIGSSGPGCKLRFHAVVFGNSEQESLEIIRLKTCITPPNIQEQIPERLEHTGIRNGNGWILYEAHIGQHKHPFRVAIETHLNNDPSSYIAVDGLELYNCQVDTSESESCAPDEFQCTSTKCISRDKMCNGIQDCACNKDETDPICGIIPRQVRSSLENCSSLDKHRCWWHDASSSSRWTLKQHGVYKYVHLETADQTPGESSILESVTFAAPTPTPRGLCQVRFMLLKSGRDLSRLVISVIEKDKKPRKLDSQLYANLYLENRWYNNIVNITNVTNSFKLQFKAYVGLKPGGSLSIAYITLSPYCFHTGNEFGTCGASGRRGPTQSMCDIAYRGEKSVHVENKGKYIGAQVWLVPMNATYSITAMGGSGGLGALSTAKIPYGDFIHAKFNLSEGEKLYFIIGQEGESACKPQNVYPRGHICNRKSNISTRSDISFKGGGGGGGGATFVFKIDPTTRTRDLLLAAGGGGGLGAMANKSARPLVAGGDARKGRGAGGGSGWILDKRKSFAEHLLGSLTCEVSQEGGFAGTGGYGGGGGGCTSGGGGGGYTGGDGCAKDEATCSGKAGNYYVHPQAVDEHHGIGHQGHGFVDVLQIRNCPCKYYCIWEDLEATSYKCLCPYEQILADDGISCIDKNESIPIMLTTSNRPTMPEDINVGIIIAVSIASIILFVMVGTTCFCVCSKGRFLQDCHTGGIGFDRIMSYCKMKKLNPKRVRQPTQLPTAVMEFNPNYDFIGAKHPQQLREIHRRHIRLVRPLGQGAFGEVYKGLLSHIPHRDGTMPVAVKPGEMNIYRCARVLGATDEGNVKCEYKKTLAGMCSDMTELDFQMEAIIVSKFHHPNIVKFVGVCFDMRPRYIILELLEGGDLKSFLRESRPKPGEPSSLTVMDLLKLAVDISRGCHHLEEKHFIHRDIAARNCLLTEKGPGRQAKIADFGMARDIYRSDYYKKAGNALLPVKWMPPEAFLDGIFTTKTDIWSFGILLWEIFSLGYMPYPGCSNEEVMHFVTVGGRLEAPDSCPSSVYDIMASCWSGLAEERPPFSLILSSLEKCMQDEDVTSRQLPILYLPKISNVRDFKLPMPLKAMGSNSGDHSTSNPSDGYLEPLLPSWITEGLPDPNADEKSEEENPSKSRANNESLMPSRGSVHTNHSSGKCHIPAADRSLLTVEDFQVLFDSDSSHSVDGRH